MKKGGFFAVLVVTALAVALFVTAVFGIYTHYGDITYTDVRSLKDMSYGLGFSGSESVVFKPSDDAVTLTDEELKDCKSVIESRMRGLVIPDFSVNIDDANKQVMLNLAKRPDGSLSITDVNSLLRTRGLFELRLGKDTDDDGNPVGTTETVILNNDMVASATPVADSNSNAAYQMLNYTNYSVNVELTSEGAELLKEALKDDIDGEAPYYSFWLDGTLLSYHQKSEGMSYKELSFTKYDYDASTVSIDAILIGTKAMPTSMLSTVVYSTTSAGFGPGSAEALMYGCIIFLALAALLMLVRYRAAGFAFAVGLIGTVGGLAALSTGMFDNFRAAYFTLETAAAVAAVIFIALASAVYVGESIKKELGKSSITKKAVSSALSCTTAPCILSLTVLAIIGLVVSAMFSRAGNWLSGLLGSITAFAGEYAYISAFAGAGRILFGGALFCILFSVLGAGIILRVLSKQNCCAAPESFGGKKA